MDDWFTETTYSVPVPKPKYDFVGYLTVEFDPKHTCLTCRGAGVVEDLIEVWLT